MKFYTIGSLIVISLCTVLLTTCTEKNDKDEEVGVSLYERLGGEPALAAVVDDFTARVAADERINHFFTKSDILKFKRLLVQHLCLVTGGGCRYTGRDMYTAHKGMGISTDDFNALVEDLTATLEAFSVPEAEKKELLNILGGLKVNIVEKK